tara:strand:- start:436 stop:1074 length:639 start_codon:yes stop_codon:yes gene_type:complete
MAQHSFIFDPDAGVAQGVNLKINTGSTLKDGFTITRPNGSAFDFTGWSGSAQMAKSVAVGATLGANRTFNVGFTSAAGGKFNVSLASTQTTDLSAGRYVWNLLLTGDTETETILTTAISAGSTAGIGTTAFTINSKTNVAVGDSVTFSTLKNAPVVGVRTNTNVIEVGSGNTASAKIMPGTAVTFSRAGTASTIYDVAEGTLIVVGGISSSP